MAQWSLVDKMSIFLFLLSILPTILSTSILSNSTSTVLLTSSIPIPPSSSIHLSITPTVNTSTHYKPTSSIVTSSSHYFSPTSTLMTPSRSVSPSPTVGPSSIFINVTTTLPPKPTKQPHSPKDCHFCERDLHAERRYKWASVSFNIIFTLALVVMTIMYLRQRKMYREMEGDGSLSRLI